jgi:LPS sulfotransferase NodH
MNYMICTTARSGSNLLCDYLVNTGVLGRPTEHFNPDIVRRGAFGRRFTFEEPLPCGDYIAWLYEHHRTPNGVFGTKVLYEDLANYFRFPAFAELMRGSRCILLRRRDKARQAVSYYFAAETGQWVHTDKPRRDPESLPYDCAVLRSHMRRLVEQETMWLGILASLGIDHREIFFEDFVRDPRHHIDAIARDLGLATDELACRASLREQGTALNRSFSERLKDDLLREIAEPAFAAEYKGLGLSA